MRSPRLRSVTRGFCIFFASVFLFLTICSAAAVLTLLELKGFASAEEDVRQKYLSYYYNNVPRRVMYDFASLDDEAFRAELSVLEEQYRFRVEINGRYAASYFSDFRGEDYAFFAKENFYIARDEYGNIYEGKPEDSSYYQVLLYGLEPQEGSVEAIQLSLLTVCHEYRYYVLAAVFVCGISAVLLLICLFCLAGRREKEGEVFLGLLDRIPAEPVLLFWGIFLAVQYEIVATFRRYADVDLPTLIVLTVLLAMDCVLGVLSLKSLAVRIKASTLWKNTFVFRLAKPLWRAWKKAEALIVSLWREVRLEPKVVIVLAGVALFDLFLATVLDFSEFLAAMLIEGVLLSVLLLWYAAGIQLLHRDLSRRVKGELDYRSDLTRLPPGLRSFGEDLNRSAEGMERALEEKMKSERFKTELITGVSHDIKTPLTSIVNYVDLMKKEEIESETLREYLEVLDRQSARLKKLTEDLVESSKAISGVLSVNLAPMDAVVLLEQVRGEYQTLLEEKGLVPVFTLPEESVFILADGKRFWRVMDNLMNNVVKYALPTTRVYLSLTVKDKRAHITLKNISAQPLSFSGEDLTERFVRGDASRNTEGSGLGLAIAKSFVELQKGEMQVFCDGDLFKVEIRFEIIE